jgi:protein-L-isoaspartate(D-aspartate) O-methyltransferase
MSDSPLGGFTMAPHMIRFIMNLRSRGVTNTAVLSAFEKIPRDMFMDPTLKSHAWDDSALPIECGQTISQPQVVAAMTQHLNIQPMDRVLEVGTGSGYQTAILSCLAQRVFSIERHMPLLDRARLRLRTLNIHNVYTVHGDGFLGWPEFAPFERIIVTAAPEHVPERLLDQLADGGVMILPLTKKPSMPDAQTLVKITKTGETHREEELFPVHFVPMVQGIGDIP